MQNLKVGEYLALWRNYKVSVTEAEPERGRVAEIVIKGEARMQRAWETTQKTLAFILDKMKSH